MPRVYGTTCDRCGELLLQPADTATDGLCARCVADHARLPAR